MLLKRYFIYKLPYLNLNYWISLIRNTHKCLIRHVFSWYLENWGDELRTVISVPYWWLWDVGNTTFLSEMHRSNDFRVSGWDKHAPWIIINIYRFFYYYRQLRFYLIFTSYNEDEIIPKETDCVMRVYLLSYAWYIRNILQYVKMAWNWPGMNIIPIHIQL